MVKACLIKFSTPLIRKKLLCNLTYKKEAYPQVKALTWGYASFCIGYDFRFIPIQIDLFPFAVGLFPFNDLLFPFNLILFRFNFNLIPFNHFLPRY